MNVKKSKNTIIESFDRFLILEHFFLKKRVELIKKIEGKTEIDYAEIAKNFLLQNIFLKKLRLDPGFRFKIYGNINKSPKLLRGITREFLQLFQDSEITKFNFEPVESLDAEIEFYEKKFHINNNKKDFKYPKVFTSALFSNNYKKSWSYQLWKYYMEHGRLQEAYASESILLEFISGYDQGYYLFWTSNMYGENRNAYHYLLEAIREIIEEMDPFLLDYIEAQRDNILLCEEMHNIIDNFNFLNIHDKIEENIDHLQDILEIKLKIKEKVLIKRSLLLVTSILYFNSLDLGNKLKLLNKFYGIETVIESVDKNPALYNCMQIVSDLPSWYNYGFLPYLNNRIEYCLNYQLETENEVTSNRNSEIHLILCKYLCKSLLEIGEYNRAFKILYSEFSFLEELKNGYLKNENNFYKLLDPQSIAQIETFFLIALIAIKSEKRQIFNFVCSQFEIMKTKTIDSKIKVKINTILSILYRKKCDFIKEKQILDQYDLAIRSFLKQKDTNFFEVFFSLIPYKLLASEDFHFQQKNSRFTFDYETGEFLEREPLIPIRHEQYYIYTSVRVKFLEKIGIENNLKYYENLISSRKWIKRCLEAQSMASFSYAINLRQTLDFYSKVIFDNENLRALYESLAFSFLYLKNYDESLFYMEKAHNHQTDDVYYNKYILLLFLFREDYSNASIVLSKMYQTRNSFNYSSINPNLKSLFQYFMMWFKGANFHNIIQKLLDQDHNKEVFMNNLDIIYCDIGLSIADIGYFDEAIHYFRKSVEVTKNKKFKAFLLNNIGTVNSDKILLDDAIKNFEEAIEIYPKHVFFWVNLGKVYELKLDYIKAKQIYDKGERYFKSENAEEAKILREHSLLMELHIRGSINLNLVKNKEALAHFKLAEQLTRNINNLNQLAQNTGVIFVALTNGFDCFFHSTFSYIFLKKMQEIFPTETIIPSKNWEKMPLGLRQIWIGNHMSVGQIEYLLNNLLKPLNDELINTLNSSLPKDINKSDLKIIKEFTSLSKILRNPSGHGEVLNKEVFIKNLPKLLELINKSVKVFNKIINFIESI